jgi:hypothetical protein
MCLADHIAQPGLEANELAHGNRPDVMAKHRVIITYGYPAEPPAVKVAVANRVPDRAAEIVLVMKAKGPGLPPGP